MSYFIIDTYTNDTPFSILKFEVEDKDSEIEIPESVKIVREVTGLFIFLNERIENFYLGVEEYRSYYLSNKQWQIPEQDLKYFYKR